MRESHHAERRLRVGVVGAGAFGRNHARVYRELSADPSQRIEFVGIADTDFARAQSLAAESKTQGIPVGRRTYCSRR